MELSKIFYGEKGYCKGYEAIEKLAKAAKVFKDVSRKWLQKQAL